MRDAIDTKSLYKDTWSDSHLDLDHFKENKCAFQDPGLPLKLRNKRLLEIMAATPWA